MSDLTITAVAHDKDMATDFLACLDPNANRFTFQFFGDGDDRYAEIFHGTLDELWPKVQTLNTLQRRVGVFVTVNETDFKGRRSENIVRVRALFADADGGEQVRHCDETLTACGVVPNMIVKTGRGMHYYFCADLPLDQFRGWQEKLIERLATDPAIKDLPRVMRLPGTLHLKNADQPTLVKLVKTNTPVLRWEPSELIAKLGLSASTPATPSATANAAPLSPMTPAHVSAGTPASNPGQHNLFPNLTSAERERIQRLFGAPDGSLSDGLETNIDEIRSAVSAIPPAAISSEPDWVRVARALAHEAAVHKTQANQIWDILDSASRQAPRYNEAGNRSRWLRYIGEAFNCANPITIATIFDLANKHGWPGWSPAALVSPVVAPAIGWRAIPIASLPLIPHKRKWVHGNDLMLGAVSLLVAPGARAKTTWLLTCALACAFGRPLLGETVFGGPKRVLYISAEDSTNEIALRIRAAMQHYGLSNVDVPGLSVIGAEDWGLPFLAASRGGPVIDARGWDALDAELDRIQPDVLILDPLINLMGGVDSNDNSAAALLMGQFVALAARRGMAVMIAHHAAKGRDPASAESAMGAASFVNLSRIVLSIEPLAEKDAGQIGLPPWEAKSIFRLLGTKQNFSPPNAEDRWHRISSVEIQNQQPPVYLTGDRVAVVEIFQPGASGVAFAPDLIRDALAAVDLANPPLSPAKQSRDRYAAPVIAQAVAHHRGGRKCDVEGKAIIDHMIDTGLVHVQPVKVDRPGKGMDTRNGLVVTPSGREVLQQANFATGNSPQSPQSPADSIAGDAENVGGDP